MLANGGTGPNMENHPAIGDYPDRLVGARERKEITLYSDVHVGRLEKQGKHPKRIQVGPNRVAWSLRELLMYVAEKIAQRDALAAESDTSHDTEPDQQDLAGIGHNRPPERTVASSKDATAPRVAVHAEATA